MSELCFDFSEIKLHKKERKMGFKYIDDLDLIGRLSEVISDEEEDLLYDFFQNYIASIKKAETLADVETIVKQIKKCPVVISVELRLENDDSQRETWAVLKWIINEEQLFDRHIGNEVYGECYWNLIFPEGIIEN
jgi:hypothetical protein